MSLVAMNFGGFNLQSGQVLVHETDVYSPPRNNVQADKLAGADGAVIVKTAFEPKTFQIAGRLRTNSREETENLINTFNTALMQPNQAFDIQFGGDVRRYVATAQNIMISSRGLSSAGFTVDFLCPRGVGSDTYNTVFLSPTTVSTSTAVLGITAGGTYQVEPLIKLTVNTVTGGTAKKITITNGSTMRGISVTRTWANGDKVEIDCLNKTLYVNNVPIDYLGQFPVWSTGSGAMSYVDDFTTRDVSIEAIYVRRWL